MAEEHNSRERLVEFLDRKVFDPILKASPDRYSSPDEKRTLEHVKRNTESEKKRFHDDYATAKDVIDNYLSDLSSRAGKRVDGDLEKLGLPKLPDFKEEFMKLSDELGVRH
jgi:hypothetical protein